MGVVLAGYATGAAIDWMRLPGVTLDPTPILAELRADRAAPMAGRANGKVAVVVFTDYQCPVCRIDHRDMERVIKSDPDARFIFKEWAILGPASREAARVALAAAYQGRYLEVRDALMRTPGPLSSQRIEQAVIGAGADWQRLQQDLTAHGRDIDAELARTSRQAFSLSLPGTPAYLIGNRLVVGRLSESKLRRLIARESSAD